MQAADMITSHVVVDLKYHGAEEDISPAICTANSAPRKRIDATEIQICAERDRKKVIWLWSPEFTYGKARTAVAISKKLTSMEITSRSTPRKKSRARCHPPTKSPAAMAVAVRA